MIARGWDNIQRGTSIDDSTSVLKLGSGLSESDGLKFNFPICLSANGKLDELALVVFLINTAEDSLALLISVSKIESKDRFVEKALINHGVERRNDLVDRNGIITKTKNTVELAEGESQTRLRSGLSEDLVLDLQVSNLEGILGHETAQAARAVANLEGSTVGLIGFGR